MTDLVVVKSTAVNGVAVAGGAVSNYVISPSLSGYSFKGIVGVQIAAGQSCTLVTAIINDSGKASVRIINNETATVTPDLIAIHALFIKNV